MAATITTQVARKMMFMGRGTVLFNDRLQSGARSLKVWGWSNGDYLTAKRHLEDAGCTVKLVTVKVPRANKTRTRLHVTEPV
jgi:hypothetical protein